jgi:hypothetical protein
LTHWRRLHNTTPSLPPVSGTSPLLRVVPPLDSASVLSFLWFFHLNFSVYIGAEVPTFRSTALQQTQATLMPDATPPVTRFRRGCSRSNDSLGARVESALGARVESALGARVESALRF